MNYLITIYDTSPSYSDARNPDIDIAKIEINGNIKVAEFVYNALTKEFPQHTFDITLYEMTKHSKLIAGKTRS